MERLDFPITIGSTTERINFHHLTDVHRASAGCDWRKWRSDIGDIKRAHTPKSQHYVTLGGDLANAIGAKDPRYDSAAIAEPFKRHTGSNLFGEEVAALCADLRPIRDQIIFTGMGNHEDAISKRYEYNPAAEVARQLDVPYVGYSAAIRLRIQFKGHVESIILFWHHGFGASRTTGGKANMLERLSEVVWNANVILTGHLHKQMQWPDVRMVMPHNGPARIETIPVLLVLGGTYQKAYDVNKPAQKAGEFNEDHDVQPDYAEKRGYRPSVIGHNGFSVRLQHSAGKKGNDWRYDLRPEYYS